MIRKILDFHMNGYFRDGVLDGSCNPSSIHMRNGNGQIPCDNQLLL